MEKAALHPGNKKPPVPGEIPEIRRLFVELRGFEPLTPCMPCRCATSCAIAPYFTAFPVDTRRSNSFSLVKISGFAKSAGAPASALDGLGGKRSDTEIMLGQLPVEQSIPAAHGLLQLRPVTVGQTGHGTPPLGR